VNPNTTYYDAGPIKVHGWTINTWNGAHYGTQTMTDILITSNNVGAVWAAERAGPERFYRYVQAFGFGQPTGIDLSGEASGSIRSPGQGDWKPIDLATNSFGQGLSVTPIQMATALAAVANGGSLLRPTVVKELRSARGTRTLEPVVVRQPLTPKGSALLLDMLNATAEKGENKLATVPGYHVGGKTGTASLPTASGYNLPTTIASYGGFAPYPNPQIVVLVKIDEPKDQIYGSLVAAPIFSALVRQALPYLGIPPSEPVKAAR
jgi:cell division protein FtsI/penicillin-binding protein 2